MLLGPVLLGRALAAGVRLGGECGVGARLFVVAQTAGTAETHDGRPYNNTYCQVIRIRDGKIAEVKEYFDTALVDAVFGNK